MCEIHKFFVEIDSEDEFLCEGPVKPRNRVKETYLYDLSMRFSLNSPECDLHHMNMLSSALTTIISHALFKQQEWTPVAHALYYQLKNNIRPSSLSLQPEEGRRLYEGTSKISGRFADLDVQLNSPKAIHQRVTYNGCVHKSTVVLKYSARLYLSSVECSMENPDSTVLPGHGFHVTRIPEPTDDGIKNLYGILEAHRAKNRTDFDHDLAWATVHKYLTRKTEETLEEMVRELRELD